MLQFLKISVSIMDEGHLKESMVKLLFQETLFANKQNNLMKKHKLLYRKIVQKVIKRCGQSFAQKMMPDHHKPLIAYIEKMKRKTANKKERMKLQALLGGQVDDNEIMDGDDAGDDSSSDSDDDKNTPKDKQIQEDVDSEESLDESEDEQRGNDGLDGLQAPSLDIPQVDSIPVVSLLAKKTKQERMAEMDDTEQKEFIKESRND